MRISQFVGQTCRYSPLSPGRPRFGRRKRRKRSSHQTWYVCVCMMHAVLVELLPLAVADMYVNCLWVVHVLFFFFFFFSFFFLSRRYLAAYVLFRIKKETSVGTYLSLVAIQGLSSCRAFFMPGGEGAGESERERERKRERKKPGRFRFTCVCGNTLLHQKRRSTYLYISYVETILFKRPRR